METPFLSIIIPTFNEASRKGPGIREHLTSIHTYFQSRRMSYEVVIVNDGSSDDTVAVIETYRSLFPHMALVDRAENRGKLYSVQEGLLLARGRYRLFTDADGATPIHNLDLFWDYIEAGEDILIGSRDLAQSKIIKSQPIWKVFLGDAGNYLVQYTLGLQGIMDTQCGFKVFSAEVVERIVPHIQALRWGGDFEILALAKKLGFPIREIAISWEDSGQSTVGIKGYFLTLWELLEVKWRLITRAYPNLRK
jgi:dolichyl-phosphate beta-glucosyltransferase